MVACLNAARRKFAGVEDGPVATRIGERVEADEWQVGLQTLLIRSGVWKHLGAEQKKAVRRARWWLYVAIDRASRCVLAMRLVETPRASEAVATLRMVLQDKSCLSEEADARTKWSMSTGIALLVCDWGSAFRSEEMRRAVASLGARYAHPPAGHPHLRGTIERIFSTFETRLMAYWTGRAFSNLVQKGDYDSEALASVPLDVLAQAIVRFVVDDYHHRPHAGLGGETPHNAWCRLLKEQGRKPLPDTDTLRDIFGVETTCTLHNDGVTVLGLRYQDRHLHEHFCATGEVEVSVRLDTEDVGVASVRLDDTWTAVPCRTPDMHGVPLRVWQSAAADLRQRFRDEAAMSRSTVLDAVRDMNRIARDCRREAGIADELDTPEKLRRAREALGFGFAVPEWDGVGDVLDRAVPVAAGEMVPVRTDVAGVAQPTAPAPTTWRIADRTERT